MTLTIIRPETISGGSTELTLNVAITTKIVLVLEYDGTRYFGFQLQTDQPTIQGAVEEALEKLTGEKLRLMGASRTDTGVHARGQVVSFRTSTLYSEETFVKGLNHYLPKDIAVKGAYKVRDSFNIQRSATSREYQYFILNSATRSPLQANSAYQLSGKLDLAAMNQACQTLIGEHDFISFASSLGPQVKRTVRQVHRAEVTRDGDMVIFTIISNSFLPHQVRNTVGSLLKVGRGSLSNGEFCSIIEARQPGLAGPLAPAGGLFLVKVNYPRTFEEEK